MNTSFRTMLVALALATIPSMAWSDDASPWSKARGASIRLVAGGITGDGREAGLEIKLEPGWKTYWRDPGDSGVPPVFDWSKSENVDAVSVSWPAPVRMHDEGGSSIGYKHDVLLPLSIRAKDPKSPIVLRLGLDYAVCEKICVPAKGEASLALEAGGGGSPSLGALIDAGKAAVPVSRPLGDTGDLSVTRVSLDKTASPATLIVEVRASGQPSLFVEGAPDWFLPEPVEVPVPAGSSATKAYSILLDGLPKSATLAGTRMRLTLASPDGAVESFYTLP